MALLRISIAKFLTCSVLVLSGCGGTASKCESDSEPGHAEEEEEECAPGSNCMCANGMAGTKVCDLMTEKLIECDCSKSGPAGAAGKGAATPTGTTTGAVMGAAGMSAAGATATATGAAGMSAATTTTAAAGASAAGAAASSTAAAGAAAMPAAGSGAATSTTAGAGAGAGAAGKGSAGAAGR